MSSIAEKLKSMEDFVENRLKTDLREIQLLLDKKVEKHNAWQELKNFIKHVRTNKPEELNTTFNIGLDVYMCARVEQLDTLIVNIGCDCYLEMYYEEADKYTDIRMKYINKDIEFLRQQAVLVKAHIKLVLLGIAELKAKP